MSLYLAIKTLHIVSSVLLAGTGFGTAFYLFFANRTPALAGRGTSMEALAVVTRLVVRADLWFTTPAAIVPPMSVLPMRKLRRSKRGPGSFMTFSQRCAERPQW